MNDADNVLVKLREVDWGNLSGERQPQFVFCVTPLDVGDTRPLHALIEAPLAHNIVQSEVNGTLHEDGTPDWLGGPIVELVSTPYEDHLEAWQPSVDGGRIGTFFIYDTGIIVTRIWILEPVALGEKVFSFMHFVAALRASLRFAGKLFKHATAAIGAVDVRSLIVNAADLDLWQTPGALTPKNRRKNRGIGDALQLPQAPFTTDASSLEAQAEEISKRFGRELLEHYSAV